MRYRKPMLITASVLAFFAALYLGVRLRSSFQFRKEVEQLFSLSGGQPGRTFHYAQLDGLPDPVQRYFRYALKDGQPCISYARIRHEGQFKAGFDKDWTDIKGEQYATTQTPGFIWKGTTSLFTARDMYIADKGRLIVSLLSVYSIVHAEGPEYDQGELLRWLGESVLYPTNLLPDERTQWSAIDARTAKLNFNYKGLSLYIIVTFSEDGQITQIETRRYMDKNTLATWIIKCSNYKELSNVLVPLSFDVSWRLDKGDFSYARFTVTEIEYDKPVKF